MITIALLLVVLGFACVIASAAGKLPLWIGVLFLALERLIAVVPFR